MSTNQADLSRQLAAAPGSADRKYAGEAAQLQGNTAPSPTQSMSLSGASSNADARLEASVSLLDTIPKTLEEALAEHGQHFDCPITREQMTTPATTKDGQAYERSAIDQWMQTPGKLDKSPMYGNTMPGLAASITDSHILKNIIISFNEMRGVVPKVTGLIGQHKKDLQREQRDAKQLQEDFALLEAQLRRATLQLQQLKETFQEEEGSLSKRLSLSGSTQNKVTDSDHDEKRQASFIDRLTKRAKAGDIDACARLGHAYLTGIRVAKDRKKAAKWLFKVWEETDHPAGLWARGLVFQKLFEKPDHQTARECFDKASGHYPLAYVSYGLCCQQGLGSNKDAIRARLHYEYALNGEDQNTPDLDDTYAPAHYRLALYYLSLRSSDPDEALGMSHLIIAARQDYPPALHSLGIRYLETNEADDLIKAVSNFQKAADQGYAPSLYQLGKCFQTGRGVQIDLAKAKYYYSLAAQQEDPNETEEGNKFPRLAREKLAELENDADVTNTPPSRSRAIPAA